MTIASFKHGILLCLIAIFLANECNAEDWPMWRRDSGRTATTTEALPEGMSLKWARQLPLIEPAYHSPRLQFDAGYEPIVADGRVLVASSRTDSVTAYELSSGRELWTYRTNGPVRFAPAVWQQSVCFGSDDGHLYCVELATGKLRWKHRAVPNSRRLLGNRRLISVWPVRGGPVVDAGVVYFAAGVWPFEGVFVYAMEIATGDLIWRNERLGHIYGQQPHNTKAIGGLAPQGYLIINDTQLIVPCSTAYPAVLNRQSGELIEFKLPAPGRLPGGWFAALDPETARDIRRGKLTFDDLVNQQQHEDKINKGTGVTGISREIHASGQTLKFDDQREGVEGQVHAMIVADKQLLVTTRTGMLYCFGIAKEAQSNKPKVWQTPAVELTTSPEATAQAKELIRSAGTTHGIAVVVGLVDGDLVKALARETSFQIVALDEDPTRVDRLRNELQNAGLSGERAAVIQCDRNDVTLPPYLANLIVTESPTRLPASCDNLLQSLRPFGGIAVLGQAIVNEERLQGLRPGGFDLATVGDQPMVRRAGALPGTTDYRGEYALSEDTLVRFPLGVLWFDDTLSHFKRSPQPVFMSGVMVSRPKDWSHDRVKGDYSVDYPLLRPVLSDIYTGRLFDKSEQADMRKGLADIGRDKPQKSYYHAPHQKTALGPPPPVVGKRTNPLTGAVEPRVFPKTYGCDGGVDYGAFYTLRSGTAAFYDKTLESGTVFISGPRSGCTNSIIPSGGVLNVPYFYEGCTCSYPLPTALSMYGMPETHEQWAAWGDEAIAPGSIHRIGLNFGAPGDRMTRDGTLWLDYPSVGGPSPKIRVTAKPDTPTFRYRHSHWIQGGTAWPWAVASSVEGLESLSLADLKPGNYTVRLYFAETAELGEGDRVQHVALNGNVVLKDFDIVAEAEKPMVGIVREIEDVSISDTLTLSLRPVQGKTLIGAMELIRHTDGLVD